MNTLQKKIDDLKVDFITQKRPKTICVDFDDTIANYVRPYEKGKFGAIKPGASEVLQKLKADGFRIIIWTCRGEDNGEITKFLNDHGVPFDEINTDRYRAHWQSMKPQADYYIDDRAIRYDDRAMGWLDIYKFIVKKETLGE